MMRSTQPAIETIREFVTEAILPIGPWQDEVLAALSAVEADLRRKDEALADADEHLRMAQDIAGPRPVRSNLINCRRRLRAALTPVSPSEPVPQQAEDVPS